MKYDEDSEDLDFPPCIVQKSDMKPIPPLPFYKKYLLILLIGGIIILALIIFLIVCFTLPGNDGGYLILNYMTKENEKIKIFNDDSLKKKIIQYQ